MAAAEKYPRGSEWRKWDLHLHSPGTKLNDQYKITGDVWDEYCRVLEESDVQVFGITDYFSADGYNRTVAEFAKRYPSSNKKFFPNLELRTTDVINKQAEEVNVHLLFSPEVTSKASEFLQHLAMNETGGGGRPRRAAELKSKEDYEKSATTRAAITEALEATFGPKAVLQDRVLIVAAVNNDGIRAPSGAKRKAANSDEFDKFSQAFFGNSKNTDFFLNRARLDSGEEIDAKPVLAGSDAHSFEDLKAWLGKTVLRDGEIYKQTAWIKADPTYEGLKQILFEPAERVFVGDEPEVFARVRNNPRRYLRELRIGPVAGYAFRHGKWFAGPGIPLNCEMVAVIGNKGSGKSAVTDILGLLGNSHNQRYVRSGKSEELFSFLNKDKFLKGGCASNFSAEVDWYAGVPDKAQLDGAVDVGLPERLEYLPQKYLEKICANIDDDEFRHKLSQVIFGYVSPDDRFGKDSLDDLVAYKSAQANEDIKAALGRLHVKNQAVVDMERKVTPDHKRDIENRIKLKEAEVAAHLGTRPPAKEKPPEIDPAATAGLGALEASIKSLSDQIAALEAEKPRVVKDVEDLNQAKQEIERNAAGLRSLEEKHKNLFAAAGINFQDLVQLKLNFATLDAVVQTKQKRVNELVSALRTRQEIEILALDGAEAEKQIKASLVCQRADVETKRKEIVEKLSKPAQDYQSYLRQDQEWQTRQLQLAGTEKDPAVGTVHWFKQEFKRITDNYPQQLAALRSERNAVSKEVFEKKNMLVAFYTAIKQSIDKEIAKYKDDLRGYAITIEAGLRLDLVLYEEFWHFISQAVKGSFYGGEDGPNMLAKLVQQVMAWDNETEVFSFLANLLEHLDKDKRPGQANEARDIFKQLRDKKDPVEFYDLLFGFPYLKLKYDLKVDGKDLSELSPGERGGLLLVFYLMLDKREIPLVIDQPEDNLDNKSVYEILVTFLKKAKKRRQIIIATHNPNLAVVADAEQILHVSIDKAGQGNAKNGFSYLAGGIEDPSINDKVVEILEGTMPAFNNRRLKYRKTTKGVKKEAA